MLGMTFRGNSQTAKWAEKFNHVFGSIHKRTVVTPCGYYAIGILGEPYQPFVVFRTYWIIGLLHFLFVLRTERKQVPYA